MISEAKKSEIDPEKLVVGSIEKTRFRRGFFDVVVGRFSFHYLKRFGKAYEEIARILKKQGVLVLVVHHPLRDLACQKKKVYGRQEIIKVVLYANKVPLYFPTHTFQDYFSQCFFEHFYLAGYEEEHSPEEYTDTMKTPGFMGIKAVKR